MVLSRWRTDVPATTIYNSVPSAARPASQGRGAPIGTAAERFEVEGGLLPPSSCTARRAAARCGPTPTMRVPPSHCPPGAADRGGKMHAGRSTTCRSCQRDRPHRSGRSTRSSRYQLRKQHPRYSSLRQQSRSYSIIRRSAVWPPALRISARQSAVGRHFQAGYPSLCQKIEPCSPIRPLTTSRPSIIFALNRPSTRMAARV